MKISAINSYNFNTTAFEGKKAKNTQATAHNTTPLKAVPVAMLIAMTPMNAPKMIAQVPTVQTEQTSEPVEDFEIVAQQTFNNATPDGSPCVVSIYDTGNNKKVVKLNFNQKINSFAIDTAGNIIDAYRIREVEITPEKLSSKVEVQNYSTGPSKVKAKYFVYGSGTEYTNPPQTLDKRPLKEVTAPIVGKVNNHKYEISEKLYKYIKQVLNGNISVDEEKSSTFIIKPTR